jgi:Tol biopolymer transport system component
MSLSRRNLAIAATALVSLGSAPAGDATRIAPDPRPSLAEPSLSADGREIAFASGGDIWTVPAAGGEARLLVSHAATESRPLWSPDGTRLAFISTRTGNGDVYILSLASGELRRITYDDINDQLDAWSRDGKWIYFSSTGLEGDLLPRERPAVLGDG